MIEWINTCPYKGVSLRASAFHWNPFTRVVIGLFLFVAFSIPFLTPATNLMAGLDTKPLRFGFALPALKYNMAFYEPLIIHTFVLFCRRADESEKFNVSKKRRSNVLRKKKHFR